MQTRSGSSSRPSGSMTIRSGIANTAASRKFESGPAAATNASPWRPRRFDGLTGVAREAERDPEQQRREDQHPAADRVEMGDRVQRQLAEHLRRAVAQPVGHVRVEELVDRERDEQEERQA